MYSKGIVTNTFMHFNQSNSTTSQKYGVSTKSLALQRQCLCWCAGGAGENIVQRHSIKPFKLYHTSKCLTFTMTLRCEQGMFEMLKKKVKFHHGSTWLMDVKYCSHARESQERREPTAATITRVPSTFHVTTNTNLFLGPRMIHLWLGTTAKWNW